MILRKIDSAGIELTTLDFRSRCSNHCAFKISIWRYFFPIYRQPIFIILLNTDKTVSRQ